jgi:FkbH-like protein
MIELKYSELLRQNRELGTSLSSKPYSIQVLSNIVVHQFKDVFEYVLRVEGINASVNIGDYDNIVQDSSKYQNADAVIIFWELSNIVDGFQYKIESFSPERINAIREKVQSEIDIVLLNLKHTSKVIINKFTALHFASPIGMFNKYSLLAKQLNDFLESYDDQAIELIDLDEVIASRGIDDSINIRNYYTSKSLYTIDFLTAYSQRIKPIIVSINGKSKKALIFDCDNTLWRGILGEDGFEAIEMSHNTKQGSVYAEIQGIAVELSKKGVIIGLCSKNNQDDVSKVISSHPDNQLTAEYITISKVNWLDKAANLRSIAEELNIGMDSIVFVDDSPFEVNLIRDQLKEVLVLQVPKNIFSYPKMLRDSLGLFYNDSVTSEDSKRNEMYKAQSARESNKTKHKNIDDYLQSLGLRVKVYKNDKSIIPRMSQLTQKTNQFNLTTNRYTEQDILAFIEEQNSDVYAFEVSDRYGESGITGLCIVKAIAQPKDQVSIDTFLMSCRIIGRNLEYAFMDYIIRDLSEKPISSILATYNKTSKNEQVQMFYDSCQYSLIDSKTQIKTYVLEISKYQPKNLEYIKVRYEK